MTIPGILSLVQITQPRVPEGVASDEAVSDTGPDLGGRITSRMGAQAWLGGVEGSSKASTDAVVGC